MRRAPTRPVRACFVRTCCTVAVHEHDLRATPVRTFFSHFTVHASHPALHTSHLHFTLDTSSHLKSCELFSPHLASSHRNPSLLTCHLSKFFSTVFISSEHWSTFLISSKLFSTHLSCSARQKAFTVREKPLAQKNNLAQKAFAHRSLRHIYTEKLPKILCTTQLAQSTSQYDFVLQDLHKALPSTTLYYETCTKHFRVLLCTTRLAQSTSQYYFVLRNLHEALPSTTLYYKTSTKHFPVLLCTTKLARSTSEYYFVLQD